MSKMAKDYNAIDLSRGYPEFNCSTELIELVNKHMRNGHNQYAPVEGIISLREIISQKTEELYSLKYDAEKEEIYSTGYPLPPGKYILSMAITSQNLEKIGTQYYEFTLPNPNGFTDALGTTPVFFVKKITRLAAPETITMVHKDYFTYSVLQVETNLDHVFTAGDNLDVFLFIFGAQPDEQNRNDIVVNYEVKKGDEAIIKYAETAYDNPLISQPLPLKRTVLIRTTKGEETKERKETRDLEPGTYSLDILIKDNLSGKTLTKTVEFSIQ